MTHSASAQTDTIPEVWFSAPSLPELGFEIMPLEHLYQRALAAPVDFAAQPHRIQFYNMLLITSGSGEHFIDFQRYPVSSGSLVLINQGQVHAFDTQNRPQGFLLLFTKAFLDDVLNRIDVQLFAPSQFVMSYQPSFCLSSDTCHAMEQLIVAVVSEFGRRAPNPTFLKVLFAALLTKASEARPELKHHKLAHHHGILFERFVHMLQKALTNTSAGNTPLSATSGAHQYADKLGTSYKTLNLICKAATGKTAKQLIDEHRILEAKLRLRVDTLQVQQLAGLLGFDEPSNFVKYFKKHTGMTPNQFRHTE